MASGGGNTHTHTAGKGNNQQYMPARAELSRDSLVADPLTDSCGVACVPSGRAMECSKHWQTSLKGGAGGRRKDVEEGRRERGRDRD